MADNKIVLVVDDSRLSRMVIRNYIHEFQPEWKIIEAKDGDDALLKSHDINIDLMTIDYTDDH